MKPRNRDKALGVTLVGFITAGMSMGAVPPPTLPTLPTTTTVTAPPVPSTFTIPATIPTIPPTVPEVTIPEVTIPVVTIPEMTVPTSPLTTTSGTSPPDAEIATTPTTTVWEERLPVSPALPVAVGTSLGALAGWLILQAMKRKV